MILMYSWGWKLIEDKLLFFKRSWDRAALLTCGLLVLLSNEWAVTSADQ